jgi:hypothetical protein
MVGVTNVTGTWAGIAHLKRLNAELNKSLQRCGDLVDRWRAHVVVKYNDPAGADTHDGERFAWVATGVRPMKQPALWARPHYSRFRSIPPNLGSEGRVPGRGELGRLDQVTGRRILHLLENGTSERRDHPSIDMRAERKRWRGVHASDGRDAGQLNAGPETRSVSNHGWLASFRLIDLTIAQNARVSFGSEAGTG